jgi:hypothetical protein
LNNVGGRRAGRMGELATCAKTPSKHALSHSTA